MGNANLHAARKAKNDEFYTRRSDIEEEMKHYKKRFRGKRIYCNCDDPTTSRFVEYFKERFDDLGLKSLTATGYMLKHLMSSANDFEFRSDFGGGVDNQCGRRASCRD